MTATSKPRYLTVGDLLVSPDLVTHHFACDLEACGGACCIEGEEGAPIAEKEKTQLLETLPDLLGLLPETNKDYILQHGVLYSPAPGAWAAMTINGGRCVFSCHEEGECARCIFERSYLEGRQQRFYKPISCHLYPIRLRHTAEGRTILYYEVWSPLCDAAVTKGEREGIPIYRFARAGLIRAFGEEWYRKLEKTADKYIATHE